MNKNRKTSNILNVLQYDENGHVVLPATLTVGENPHSSDNTSKIPSTSWIRTYVTGLSYLTGNQSITVSGDATGSGTTAITLTLANTAVTPGTYGSTTLVPVVTVDSKGRITSVTTAAISGSLTFTGDVTGTGTTGTSTGLTLAASGVTAGTYTKVTVDSKGRVTVGANASTTDISEGTNLYYTDTRVGTYLTANSYATQSYVGTQIANLVASAPATLDTLNELSVALGNDPNFATSVATSIGTKQAQLNGTGFVKVIGTTVSYDNNTYLTSFTETDPIYVASTWYSTTNNATNWNTAYGWGNHASGGYLTGITSSQVTTALGYTPYNSTNPSGYITGITSSNVTTALGYTPYNSTNPNGYITGITSGNVTTALGYTPYNSTNPSGYISSYTETDTLSSVVARGSSTTAAISAANFQVASQALNLDTVKTPGLYHYDGAYTGTQPIQNWYNVRTIEIGNSTRASQFVMPYNVDRIFYRRNTDPGWQGYVELYHTGNLPTIPTNNNQLTNGAGYITGITSGNVTTALGFTPYNATNPSGYITSSATSLTLTGNLTVSSGNTTGGGIILADDGDIVDLNDAYLSLRFSSGVRVFSANRGGSAVITLANTGAITATGNVTGANLSGTNTGDQTTITGNAGSATLLKSINTTTSALSNWNPQSLTYQAWGQAWTHSSIGGDSGDMVLWLRAGQYSAGGTEVCMIIDGDYYAANGAHKVWHAGNLTNNNQLTNGAGYITSSGSISGNAATANSATNAVYLGTHDLRTIAPNSHDAYKLRFGFTSYSNNNTAPWADYLHLRSYGDSSGGADNLVMFLKSGIGMRIWQQSWNSGTAYSSYADVWHSGNFTPGNYLALSGGTVTGDTNFGPDSGGDNGIRIRYGNSGAGYGRIRFHQDGTNHNTIHSFSASWQGGSFLGASAGALNIAGQYGVTFGGWNIPDAHINTDGIYVKAWATPSGSTGWNANSVLRLQQGSTGNDVYIEMRNRADVGDHAAILFTDNNVGGYIGFRTYASNNVAAGSDCMIYGTYNDHIFQNGSSGVFNGKTETFRIYANGSIRATGDVTAYSDKRVKENIITIDKALEKTLQLRGVFYNRTDKDDKSQKVGVIAQEIQEILPQVVNEDYNGLLSVSYGNITGLLIEAIKEQQLQIEELKNKLDGLTR